MRSCEAFLYCCDGFGGEGQAIHAGLFSGVKAATKPTTANFSLFAFLLSSVCLLAIALMLGNILEIIVTNIY